MMSFESEKNLDELDYGINRGKLWLEFFDQIIKEKNKKTILDFGCGKGGLSIAFSKEFKNVIGLDINKEDLNIFKNRIKEREINNIEVIEGDAAYPRFENIDVTINVGLIEWIGHNSPNSPFLSQQIMINYIEDCLNENGILITATENRFFPYFWIREPHNHSFLLGLLPYKISNPIYKFFTRKNYYHRMLYYSELGKIFEDYEVFVGIPNYQYPHKIVKIDNYGEIITSCNQILKQEKLPFKLWLQAHWMKYCAIFRLTKLFTTNLIIVSRKVG